MIVTDHTALISDWTWDSDPNYGRFILTYAMPASLPDYIRSIASETQAFLDSFQAVTGQAADIVHAAFDIWEGVANIDLIEVNSADADIMLGLYEFDYSKDNSQFIGYAYYPDYQLNGYGIGGDVFVDTGYASNIDIWLHEIGHALGLKHPFEGDLTLGAAMDNTTYTVMSYTGPDTGTLGSLDDDALSAIYGAPTALNMIISEYEARWHPAEQALAKLTDFDGNDLGHDADWVLKSKVDVQGDGDEELIFFNSAIGRWATLGPDANGLINFANHSWGGDTRVVGIYIDPLVESGDVVKGSDFDSQRRFQNDLLIDNIAGALNANDYNGDGLQEIFFSLTDQTAFLHAYMHADGNIQYANYQSASQLADYLTSFGFDESYFSDWFTA